MEALTKGLTFGARAFEGAQLRRNLERCRPQNVHMKDVPGIVLASYPEAAKMRGERGKQKLYCLGGPKGEEGSFCPKVSILLPDFDS
ncbi:unnamed protein product [Cladocopium goreaui]|uniref:Uncharacterized protein n=1 Tax=Cladocopium goreaui TaxID=2562237 RepID=A0A9P1GG77_9DINO|nr:unnamed protein product [Cladocopium goreaui]